MRLVALAAAVLALGSADGWRRVERLSSGDGDDAVKQGKAAAAEAKKKQDEAAKAAQKAAEERDKKKLQEEQKQREEQDKVAEADAKKAEKDEKKRRQKAKDEAKKALKDNKSLLETVNTLEQVGYLEQNEEGSEHPASFVEFEGNRERTIADDAEEAMDAETARFPGPTNIPQFGDGKIQKEWPKTTGPEAEQWVDQRLKSDEDTLQWQVAHHKGLFGKHPETIEPQQQFLRAMQNLAGLVKLYDRNAETKADEIKTMKKLERKTKAQFEADQMSLRSDAPESERWHLADENGHVK